MRGFSITLLILVFISFLIYQTQKSNDFVVLKVNTPVEIIVDLNKNGVKDNNEIINIAGVKTFYLKPSESQAELSKKLKISQEEAIGLGFLAQNYARETLEGKKVKIDNAEILINNKNYSQLLLNQGYAVKENEEVTLQLKKNIEKVKKLNFVILNNKNHKYHLLNCKYGIVAHNAQIMPAVQLPKDAIPCKFCHGIGQKSKDKKQNVKKFFDEIPDVKSVPTCFQTANIKIFLTDMTKVLKPSNYCSTVMCQALLREINSAQSSIDFAIYGYTKVPAIQNALENAISRGVKIRFVYDSDENGKNIYPDTLYLSKILVQNNSDKMPQLMHDKFFIFDKKIVLTGSANISNTDMSGFNSNVVLIINSDKVADFYSQEFEQMYEGKFHKAKSIVSGKQEKIENTDLQIYFTPKDKALTELIPLIDNAKSYIYIPAFLITHKGLSDSLISASNRGVAVKIILDATNTHTSSSKMKVMRQNGIQVKTENFAGKLHSKSIIIDDLYAVIGSMNFSRSGEGVNDENLVVIKNKDIAVFYKTFFQYLWKRIPDYWLTHNARAESPDSVGSCSDGIDNDFDGKIDKVDESCSDVRF